MPGADQGADAAPPAAYPQRWENDAVLSDGGTVHLRPIRPSDAERVRAFHGRQSKESIYFRYFSPMPTLGARELDRLTKIDYVTRMALVAVLNDEIIGMASYDLWRRSDEAEVAFIVDDDHQGRGLATVLLEYLIVAARENGLQALTAQVLPNNRRMMSVFHHVGFEVSSEFDEGIIEVRLGLEPTDVTTALIEERERRAEARSVARILFPDSIAVIGASRERGGIGHEVFRTLVANGFEGPVFPVNPQGGHVGSVRSYSSVLDIPDEVDLAVIAVPAVSVPEVVDQCARKRVRGLVIISAGFGSLEIDGRAAQDVVAERALGAGMRLIGPESMGVINTAPTSRLFATFASVRVDAGRVGFLTQSGTLGIAALERAGRMGIGISAFVDIGSRADVSANDLLQYWSEDERTSVVLLYLESFGNLRKFTRLVRRMARQKPIVAVKSGRSNPAERALEGQGLASLWPGDATVDALLAQSGVIRVDTPAELFDLARVLVQQPVPKGRRVAIVSNATGASLLSADACLGAGLELAELLPETREHLDGCLPAGSTTTNPIEVTWAAGPSHYEAAIGAVLADPGVDSVLVVYAPPVQERRAQVARAIGAAASASADKPIVATFLGSEVGMPLVSGDRAVPLFEFPGEAAQVLGRLAGYADWLAEPEGEVPDVAGIDAVRAVTTEMLAQTPDGRWLDRDEAARLLRIAGFDVVPHQMVRGIGEAVAAAEAIGFPVTLKATGVTRYQRGEEGGVALDLYDTASLEAAFDRMRDLLGAAMDVAVVQQQTPPGVDVLVGGHQHPSYGGVVSLGVGGVMAAANLDLPVRVLPLTDADAERLVRSSAVAPLLAAQSGSGSAARACAETLARLGGVLDAVPEIADVVLNPLIVGEQSAWVVDAWVRVAPYRWEPAPEVRRIR